jgi:dienelactone hydrolase
MAADSKVVTEVVEYRHGDVVLEGYLAYEKGKKSSRPGVLVVHEWMGLNDYARMRAEKLADLGYVAFAVDMYGKGVRARDSKEAAALAGIYKGDRQLMRARILAGLEVLISQPKVDPKRIAAIGYCFGGTTVLELARSGADVDGVVSFHGALDTSIPAESGRVRAKVLVLHGRDDPLVPPEQVNGFEAEMRNAGVDWQLVAYGGAVHSFTNPQAGSDPSKGVAYNEKADKRSWKAMKEFFDEIF